MPLRCEEDCRAESVTEVLKPLDLERKPEFAKQIRAYWMLKRQSRHGVPLLRRLFVCV